MTRVSCPKPNYPPFELPIVHSIFFLRISGQMISSRRRPELPDFIYHRIISRVAWEGVAHPSFDKPDKSSGTTAIKSKRLIEHPKIRNARKIMISRLLVSSSTFSGRRWVWNAFWASGSRWVNLPPGRPQWLMPSQ